VQQKPKIRKTKEELIMENELQHQRQKAGLYHTANGFGDYSTKRFSKPSLNLDPLKMKTNAKFDDIPDGEVSQHQQNKAKVPSKPSKPQSTNQKRIKDQQKEPKPITGKLTNIAFDTKTNTAYNVERQIDRLHTVKKEVTQKPNFARYEAPGPALNYHHS
jgi:hypothetical protein